MSILCFGSHIHTFFLPVPVPTTTRLRDQPLISPLDTGHSWTFATIGTQLHLADHDSAKLHLQTDSQNILHMCCTLTQLAKRKTEGQ